MIREIALALFEPDQVNEHEPVQLGDIAAVRKPVWYTDHPGNTTAQSMGTKEMLRYLWLRVEGLGENEWGALKQPLFVASLNPDGAYETERYEKRRYCVPLSRLSELFPAFDMNRALDSADPYQPFLEADLDGYYLTSECCALDVHGLVWDKKINGFL